MKIGDEYHITNHQSNMVVTMVIISIVLVLILAVSVVYENSLQESSIVKEENLDQESKNIQTEDNQNTKESVDVSADIISEKIHKSNRLKKIKEEVPVIFSGTDEQYLNEVKRILEPRILGLESLRKEGDVSAVKCEVGITEKDLALGVKKYLQVRFSIVCYAIGNNRIIVPFRSETKILPNENEVKSAISIWLTGINI